ncbi:putative RNA-directed DNA polymerase from transposon X-element [Trichonephila clavipes]|nr:putative RNA-directed DNA polymerase from transposon X-element [Trichonephila clavipes]
MAPMIIFGDFNLHHPMWGSDHISRYSNEFVEWITDSNLVLLNTTVPTYRSSADATSLIDLTVCSSSMSGYCNSYVLDCSFESDHSPIITELSLLNSNKRIFKKVNWQAVMNQTHFILNNPEVNSENLSDKISQVITNNIREIKVSNRPFPPWWNITDTDQKLNILQLNNRFITHPQLQADMFADYFASKNAYREPLPLDFLYDKNNLLNKPFHILELHSAIKNSKNTTPGADHVTAIFFKNLDQGQRDVILRYFQKIFDNAIVPDSWKHAILLPIPQPCKDKTKISSYRPIALTSVFSKNFERILANRISYYLTKRKLHPQHYGFVPFKDSRSATYLVHKAMMNAKLQKFFFVGISLDIKSAYDSVYVDGLIYKCLQIETLAICQALDDLVESNVNLLVLSDSLSVLSALQNFSIKFNKLSDTLYRRLLGYFPIRGVATAVSAESMIRGPQALGAPKRVRNKSKNVKGSLATPPRYKAWLLK